MSSAIQAGRSSVSRTFSGIGYVSAILSLTLLIRHALDKGTLIAPLQVILTYYEKLVDGLIGWAHPHLHDAVNFIAAVFGIRIVLEPDWRHVFVLMMLFFSAVTRDFIRHVDHDNDDVPVASPSAAIATWVLGVFVSIVTGVLVGITVASSNTDQQTSLGGSLLSLAIALLPTFVIGLFFVAHGVRYWRRQARLRGEGLLQQVRRIPGLQFAAIVALALAVSAGLALGSDGGYQMALSLLNSVMLLPRVVIMLLSTLIVAVFFVGWGALNSLHMGRRGDASWLEEFKRSTWTSVGLSILGVFIGAIVVLMCNAGGELLGL